MCGKVWLVGAGPGDAGLITVKGKALLELADVVIYDALIQLELLVQIPEKTKKIHVGKRAGNHSATQEEIKTETVADIVQSLPSFTETRADDLVLPSLHMANRELRRAKNHLQKWERVCAALRELNKHRDIVRQITDSSRHVASEK